MSVGHFLYSGNWSKRAHCGWSHFIGWTMEWRKRREKLGTSRPSLILSALDFEGNLTNCLSSCLDFPPWWWTITSNTYFIVASFLRIFFNHRNRHETRMPPFAKGMETTVREWKPRFPPASTQPWVQVAGQWTSAKAASMLVDSCQRRIAIEPTLGLHRTFSSSSSVT